MRHILNAPAFKAAGIICIIAAVAFYYVLDLLVTATIATLEPRRALAAALIGQP